MAAISKTLVRGLLVILAVGQAGCMGIQSPRQASKNTAPHPNMPSELSKVVLPTYIIEPPDILRIDVLHIAPRGYRLRTFDQLGIRVEGVFSDYPIEGIFQIQPGGTVFLGPQYGTVRVFGLTLVEAKQAIESHLRTNANIREPRADLFLEEISGLQPIAGEHLVNPDGTVTLGNYGSVSVVGLTVDQARMAVENHLAQFLEDPKVAVDVMAYNSKVYYVITEGAGLGDGVIRLPITGNETVLDAVSNLQGLTQVSSKRMWIARPSPHDSDVQILPVDWKAITATGVPTMNYQLLPGDRLFIAENKLVSFDTALGKLMAPFERTFGFTLLGTGTLSRLSGRVLNNQGGGGFGGFGGF